MIIRIIRFKPMPKDLAELSAAVGAALATLHRVTPETIRELVPIAVLFIALDTVTGVWLAATRSIVLSRKLKDKLIAKCLQYAALVALGGAASVLAHNWVVVGAALGAIVGIETLSILENLSYLEQHGGVNLGPARPFLERIRRYLAECPGGEPEKKEQTVEQDGSKHGGDS